jgi:hypothetical protein
MTLPLKDGCILPMGLLVSAQGLHRQYFAGKS